MEAARELGLLDFMSKYNSLEKKESECLLNVKACKGDDDDNAHII